LDIPAKLRGASTIFDLAPGELERRQTKRWARRQLIELRRACERNHGHAIEPYIQYLIKNMPTLKQTVLKRIAKFKEVVGSSKLDGALEHAATNFGLIYAGGSLAIEAKLLPWDRKRLLTAVVTCFEAAIEDVRGHEYALPSARALLEKKLKREDIREAGPEADFGPQDHAAFFRRVEGAVTYTIQAKLLRKWIPRSVQLNVLLRWLQDEGHLQIGEKRTARPQVGSEWAEQTPRWPNGQNARAFVFRDPFGLRA
jgi:hypothetical protein